MGIFDHSSRSAIVRSHTDLISFIPKVFYVHIHVGAIPKLFPQSWEHGIVQHLLAC